MSESGVWKMKTATKMYLSVILSTLCIMFYQYQLSKANFITSHRNVGESNGILNDRRVVNSNAGLVRMNYQYNQTKQYLLIILNGVRTIVNESAMNQYRFSHRNMFCFSNERV